MGKEFDRLLRASESLSEEEIAAVEEEIYQDFWEFNQALIQGILGKKIRDEAATTRDKLKQSAGRSRLGSLALWAAKLKRPVEADLLIQQRETIFAKKYAAIQSPIVGNDLMEKDGKKIISGWVVEIRNYSYDSEEKQKKRQIINGMYDDIYLYQATINEDDMVELKPFAKVIYNENTSAIAMYDGSYDFSNPNPEGPDKSEAFKILTALMFANEELSDYQFLPT